MECKELKGRLSKLESERQVVQEQWDLVRQYVVPFRGQFFKDTTSEGGVDWRENRRVYDSTAVNANNILASSLHGAITNPSHQWFAFRFQSDELSDNKEAAQWLHDASQITFETLRDSNFNLQVNECYIDFTSFGTAFITKEVEELDGGFDELMFKSIPLEESYFEQDYKGNVHIFYRKVKWSALMIYSKFGDEGTPQDIIDKAKQGNAPGQKDIEIVFAVYRRDGNYDPTVVATPERREYGYKYFLYKDGEQLGEEGGYYQMPVLVMRWRNTADSMWGHSPAMIALPDIITLNQLVELILDSLEKVVDPAIKVTERGLLSDLNLGPAGLNVVRKMDDMDAFESRARFDVAELNRANLQSSIRSIFYVDQLELKESPAMTATEVSVRYEMMQRLLGPTLGRLESDFLDPLVKSVFADLIRYRKLPPIPEVIGSVDDPRVIVEYTGPMARAQKLDMAQSLTNYLMSAAQIGEIKPDALDKIDFDQSMELLAQYHQVEPKVLKSDAAVKKTRDEREDQQRRMAEAEIGEKEGKAEQALAEGGRQLSAI